MRHLNKIKNIFLIALFGLSIALMFIGGIIGYVNVFKDVKIHNSSTVSYDGITIGMMIVEPNEEHDRFGEETYGVVLAHGLIVKPESNILLATELGKAGFTVLVLDERGQGISGGDIINPISRNLEGYKDIVRCAQYFKENYNCNHVGTIGHSAGGISVTLASIWSEEQGVSLDCTIAVSSTSGVPDPGVMYPKDYFDILGPIFYSDYTNVDLTINITEGEDPNNFLSVMDNYDMFPVSQAIELAEAAGGVGRTTPQDFANMDASDAFNYSSGGHGSTLAHETSIARFIDWFEKSMGISEPYEFNPEGVHAQWDLGDQWFQYATIGGVLLLIPAYWMVKNKILIKNKTQKDEKNLIDGRENVNFKNIIIFAGLSTAAMFGSPFITRLLILPVLHSYGIFNVLIRDLSVAAIFIVVLLFLVFKLDLASIFNKENAKKFGISLTAASIMLCIFLTTMNVFGTFQQSPLYFKWQPISLTPIIIDNYLPFILYLINFVVIVGIIEYFCRVVIQNNLIGLKDQFSVKKTIFTIVVNSIVKVMFLSMLIIGLFTAYDPALLPAFLPRLSDFTGINVGVLFIGVIIGLFAIVAITEIFLTITYHHSKDFWFVVLCSYVFFAWGFAGFMAKL